MNDSAKKITQATPALGRRGFLGSAAVAGLAGVGLAACSDKPQSAPAAKVAGHANSQAGEPGGGVHLKPGELDTYYGLWSGGHTGDLRVLGLPSGREITRIPVFVP